MRMDKRGSYVSLIERSNSWALLNTKGKISTVMIFEYRIMHLWLIRNCYKFE